LLHLTKLSALTPKEWVLALAKLFEQFMGVGFARGIRAAEGSALSPRSARLRRTVPA